MSTAPTSDLEWNDERLWHACVDYSNINTTVATDLGPGQTIWDPVESGVYEPSDNGSWYVSLTGLYDKEDGSQVNMTSSCRVSGSFASPTVKYWDEY